MHFNLKSLQERVPLTWFLGREDGADLYICNNTAEVSNFDGEHPQYVDDAEVYRANYGCRSKERYVMISDSLNSARKTSYLLAGDIKNDYYEDEEGNLTYTKSELDGVVLAEVNLASYCDSGYRALPMDVDGVIFYGAASEEDIRKNIEFILSCDQPYVAVVVDEKLMNTDTVRRMVFDNWFGIYECLGSEADESEVVRLFKLFIEDNQEKDGINDKISIPVDEDESLFDERVRKLYRRIKDIRREEFREEDLIRMADLITMEADKYI